MARKSKETESLCPCGSGRAGDDCCGPYLKGARPAPTAEALMRSRYCAYVRNDGSYLLHTWHETTRPPHLELSEKDGVRWLGLKILRTEAGAGSDEQGTVEFVARFKRNGRAERLHETSRFLREGGRWYYLDGDIQPDGGPGGVQKGRKTPRADF